MSLSDAQFDELARAIESGLVDLSAVKEWMGCRLENLRAKQLIRLLYHSNQQVREFAMTCLRNRELRGNTYPAIVAAKQDVSATVRMYAVSTLFHCCPRLSPPQDIDEMVDILAGCLDDQDRRVRQNAARELNRLGDRAKGALELVLELASDPCPYVRCQAIQATYRLGATPSQYEQLFASLENDDHKTVRAMLGFAQLRLQAT